MDLMSNPMLFDLTTDVGFALALNEIRRLKRGSCAVVAICCNSFTAMCLSCICVCVCVWWVSCDCLQVAKLPAVMGT